MAVDIRGGLIPVERHSFSRIRVGLFGRGAQAVSILLAGSLRTQSFARRAEVPNSQVNSRGRPRLRLGTPQTHGTAELCDAMGAVCVGASVGSAPIQRFRSLANAAAL